MRSPVAASSSKARNRCPPIVFQSRSAPSVPDDGVGMSMTNFSISVALSGCARMMSASLLTADASFCSTSAARFFSTFSARSVFGLVGAFTAPTARGAAGAAGISSPSSNVSSSIAAMIVSSVAALSFHPSGMSNTCAMRCGRSGVSSPLRFQVNGIRHKREASMSAGSSCAR